MNNSITPSLESIRSDGETALKPVPSWRLRSLQTRAEENLAQRDAFYRPELDILRFFAFLLVFMVHIASFSVEDLVAHQVPRKLAIVLSGLGRGGAYGVDVFFVLSAYLITQLLLREKEKYGTLHVKAFYIRRILRIWPLYYLFIPLVTLCPWLNPTHEFTWRYAVPFLLLVGNWSFVIYGWTTSLAVPLWSVSVEEQFYLLWAPLVARLSRRRIAITACAMICTANAVRWSVFLRHGTSLQLWANTFAHLDSFAGGILLAVFLRGKVPTIPIFARILMIVAGVSCFAVRGHFVTILETDQLGWYSTVLGYPLIAVSCTMIVWAFIGLPFRFRPLVYLGKISYGLYVYHMMCIFFADRILGAGHGLPRLVVRVALALGMTTLVSSLSYNLLEKPFLKLKNVVTFVPSREA